MKIISINTGTAQEIKDYHGKAFVSAIGKSSISMPTYLGKLGLQGDECVEDCHGGAEMALHLFCYDHYAFFNEKAGFELPNGAFGENISISGYSEKEANVGDVLQLDDALIQVTQPTERCRTIGRSLGLPKLLKWIHLEMMTGLYLRVLEPGTISVTPKVRLVERGDELLNIASLNDLMFNNYDLGKLQQVCQQKLLNQAWKERAFIHYQRAGFSL